MYFLIPILLIFLAGLYFYINYNYYDTKEGLTNNNGEVRCPNILIQKGTTLYLYNSKIAKVPGVNPVEFENLEEYVEFMNWQRSQGIRCPVLFLQHTYDAQGQSVYKIRPSPTDLQGGLPPSLPYPTPNNLSTTFNDDNNINGSVTNDNNNNDTLSQGELDNLLYSPDAMSDKWGGQEYTQMLIDKGYYKGNEVNIMIT